MGMLEDDLSQHPPVFSTREPKVHLFHDWEGRVQKGDKGKPVDNTACASNHGGALIATSDTSRVTCQRCLRAMTVKMQSETWPTETVTTASTIEIVVEKRHRLNWRGKLVLQIRETYHSVDDRDAFDFGHNETRWRDATLSDLNVGVV